LDPALNFNTFQRVRIEGNCADPSKVRLVRTNTAWIIGAEDFAIVNVFCLLAYATNNGGALLTSRQLAILDYAGIYFGPIPEGIHVSVTDGARASCVDNGTGPIHIFGDAAANISANQGARVSLGCKAVFDNTVNFSAYFAICTVGSVCSASGFGWSGAAAGGEKLAVDNSDFTCPNTPDPPWLMSLPGSGTYRGNNAIIRGTC